MIPTQEYVRAVLKFMNILISKSTEGTNRKIPTSSQICALPQKIHFWFTAFLPPFYMFKIPL
jgi:hypothetical protein